MQLLQIKCKCGWSKQWLRSTRRTGSRRDAAPKECASQGSAGLSPRCWQKLTTTRTPTSYIAAWLAGTPRISLATVYRTVRRLEAEGILERHEFRDGRARYETAARKHHDHLIDLETGSVIEFSSPEIERLQDEIASRLGYRIAGHRLELYAMPLRTGDRKRRPR